MPHSDATYKGLWEFPQDPLMAAASSQYLKIAFLFIKKMPWKSK